MTRIDGDTEVALALRVIRDDIEGAIRDLGRAGEKPADRCVHATARLARANVLFGMALGKLEQLTDVPWGAIMEDTEFGRKPATPHVAPGTVSGAWSPGPDHPTEGRV